MSTRRASVLLVVGAALADAAGHHSVAYYALVVAVPVLAIAALAAFGDVLDGTAATPHDRLLAVLTGIVLAFVLLATAVRAPVLSDGAPPPLAATAVLVALGLFAVQALISASVAAPRERLRAALRANR
jgi:hypothetical protein